MSFMDSVPPLGTPGPGSAATPARRSAWRWFPWIVALSLLVVIVVNGGMMWVALSTFPGAAGADGFDLSNGYDHVLDRAARQAALGWSVQAGLDADAHPLIALTDRAGAPLAGARIEARAERPVGPADRTTLTFQATGDGQYRAAQALPEPGQWDLLIAAGVDGKTVSVTRRVIVR
jgi:nitrogen fixation protein FixH